MKTRTFPLIAMILGIALMTGLIGFIQYTRNHTPLVTEVTTDNFTQVVGGSSVPVYIEFYSKDCDHCTKEAPVVEKVAADYQGKVKFVRIDADANPAIAAQAGVDKVPAHFFLNQKAGKLVGFKGYLDEANLRKFIELGLNLKADAKPAADNQSAPQTAPTK